MSSNLTLNEEEIKGQQPQQQHFDSETFSTRSNSIVSRNSELTADTGQTSSSSLNDVHTSENFTFIPSGFQAVKSLDHASKDCCISAITFNGRTKKLVIAGGSAIWTWDYADVSDSAVKVYDFPKYEYKVVKQMLYVKKFNVYFILKKNYNLMVLNGNFEETFLVDCEMTSIMFIKFNRETDELLTGSVEGIKIWKYDQIQPTNKIDVLKPMINYGLVSKGILKNPFGDSWIKMLQINYKQQLMYGATDSDLFVYDFQKRMKFSIERAHDLLITSCVYSAEVNLMATTSVDCTVKIWNTQGSHVHTFRGHAGAITAIVNQPDDDAILITSSLDGSIRVWSLHIFEHLYTLTASSEGIVWLGLIENTSQLFSVTEKVVNVWNMNNTATFFSVTRCPIVSINLVQGQGQKTNRIFCIGEDSSMRIIGQQNRKNLSTILPPPNISPLNFLQTACYNRQQNVVYAQIDSKHAWLYTTKTNPSCKLTEWNLIDVQKAQNNAVTKRRGAKNQILTYTAVCESRMNNSPENVECLSYLSSHIEAMADEGLVSSIEGHFVIAGLRDGRILFMDPLKKGFKHAELQAHKEAITGLKHDQYHNRLLVKCNGRTCIIIQIWSLPSLQLMNEVYAPTDLTQFAVLENSIMMGFQVGLTVYEKLKVLDNDLQRMPPSFLNDEGKISRATFKPDHLTPVTSVDSCMKENIYLSSSIDGVLKIWLEEKVLITEINLETPLTASAFLNNFGDVLIGWKNHLFLIHHTKICSLISSKSQLDALPNETESFIYEDPDWHDANVHSEDMDLYLVPYPELQLTNDFLLGKVIPFKKEEPVVVEDEESTIIESEYESDENAPTEIFMSTTSSMTDLANVDYSLMEHKTDNQSLIEHGSKWYQHVDDAWPSMPHFGVTPSTTPQPNVEGGENENELDKKDEVEETAEEGTSKAASRRIEPEGKESVGIISTHKELELNKIRIKPPGYKVDKRPKGTSTKPKRPLVQPSIMISSSHDLPYANFELNEKELEQTKQIVRRNLSKSRPSAKANRKKSIQTTEKPSQNTHKKESVRPKVVRRVDKSLNNKVSAQKINVPSAERLNFSPTKSKTSFSMKGIFESDEDEEDLCSQIPSGTPSLHTSPVNTPEPEPTMVKEEIVQGRKASYSSSRQIDSALGRSVPPSSAASRPATSALSFDGRDSGIAPTPDMENTTEVDVNVGIKSCLQEKSKIYRSKTPTVKSSESGATGGGSFRSFSLSDLAESQGGSEQTLVQPGKIRLWETDVDSLDISLLKNEESDVKVEKFNTEYLNWWKNYWKKPVKHLEKNQEKKTIKFTRSKEFVESQRKLINSIYHYDSMVDAKGLPDELETDLSGLSEDERGLMLNREKLRKSQVIQQRPNTPASALPTNRIAYGNTDNVSKLLKKDYEKLQNQFDILCGQRDSKYYINFGTKFDNWHEREMKRFEISKIVKTIRELKVERTQERIDDNLRRRKGMVESRDVRQRNLFRMLRNELSIATSQASVKSAKKLLIDKEEKLRKVKANLKGRELNRLRPKIFDAFAQSDQDIMIINENGILVSSGYRSVNLHLTPEAEKELKEFSDLVRHSLLRNRSSLVKQQRFRYKITKEELIYDDDDDDEDNEIETTGGGIGGNETGKNREINKDHTAFDPRTNEGIKWRQERSVKSIPNKTYRYILVKKTKDDSELKIIPTSLEIDLIPKRFPNQAQRWLGPFLK
ncbi:DgyrCDS13526 [Dimorphilus gyrociliatus]|uniref:DgyrCDS13526 n=1 Tax=Dimorphilus gyrociliatus TaxID=2664684 RepID=A0A7I8WAX6_9ANNE|nr:DgyrCDS13526 [Dimorphilus gyrociliatus]